MIKFKTIYNRKKKLKLDGTALIQIAISQDRCIRYIGTDISIEPIFWDKKNKNIHSKHTQATAFNAHIENMLNELNEIRREGLIKGQKLTLEGLLSKFQKSDGDLLEVFISEEIEKDNLIKEKTKKDHRNTLTKLIDFKAKVKIIEVDYRFVREFDQYLRDKKLSVNTIAKQHKNLKRYINLAIKFNLMKQDNYPYSQFRVKKEETKREVLSYDDILKIWELKSKLQDDNLEVQMMFSFACFTGLRISDVIGLKWEHVKTKDDGFELKFKSYKTGKMVNLPLHLLFKTDKYKCSNPELIIHKLLPRKINNQRYIFTIRNEGKINNILKGLAEEANITLNLTFHFARHSFGTYMATKVPLPTLQELMQHSSIKTTMIYVNMTEKMIKNSLNQIDWNN